MKVRFFFSLVIVTLAVASCAERTKVLYAEPSSSLKTTVQRLQTEIDAAEASGCDIKTISMGAGHGTGVGHGIGVGVGVNIDADCPDCVKRDISKTVIKENTKTKSESIFGAIAMAKCPR